MLKIRALLIIAILIMLCLGLVGIVNVATSAPAVSTLRLLADSVLGRPVASEGYLFWRDNRTSPPALYGYDPAKQAGFVVTNDQNIKLNFASDGQRLVWVQSQTANTATGTSIWGYDLSSRRNFQILPTRPDSEYGGLAIAGDKLYYQDGTPGHVGLYERDLSNGQEQLISPTGQSPIANRTALVWSEQTYQGELSPPHWSLHVRPLDKPAAPSIKLAASTGAFTLNLAQNRLVWSALPPAADQRAYSYQIGQPDPAAPLSNGPVRDPITSGQQSLWAEVTSAGLNGFNLWSAQLYNAEVKQSTSFIAPGSAKVQPVGFVRPDQLAVLVSSDQNKTTSELYLASTTEKDLKFAARTRPVRTATPNPLNCGQVYKIGYQLYDCNGRWTMDGTQFILPERGINGQSFHDDNYAASSDQLNYWLDLASTYLQAKTLRIFVDMPNQTLPGPTSPATLYDFALRASQRGMRLGLVLHNDTSWTLTPARQSWLTDLITYFSTRRALATIAYVNADNEINNHCGDAPDCFDNNPTYVGKATQWTADFTNFIKSKNSLILTTVGITTEKADGDGLHPVYDFFRTATSAPSLAASVDFLSPHNYGGGGYGLGPLLRNNLSYGGPIMLEEYGYPTDVKAVNAFFDEGQPVCRDDPMNSVCQDTAPYFVEVNARAQRENSFNGLAGGSAWMLADSNAKNCTSPYDFYTGLFASGNYPTCTQNGTTTTTTGQPKNTAARIKFHHETLNPTSTNLVVVLASDNGQGDTPGTLSYLLKLANDPARPAAAGKTIVFDDSLTQITLTGGSWPSLSSGVAIVGRCGANGPLVTLNGNNRPADGLTLTNNNMLSGLKITNFAGRQIVAPPGQGRFTCFKAER